MRVTIDGALKDDLETLRCLLSHKIPQGDLAAVLPEAVRCGIDKHGRRRGLVKPERPRKVATKRTDPDESKPRRPSGREPIPAQVKRAVWERDGYRCTYVSPDGRRCQSRWQLELDHAEPVALGGPSTVETIRGRCRIHNLLHAEEVFGREHMARFRRKGPEPRTGESAIAGESAQSVKG